MDFSPGVGIRDGKGHDLRFGHCDCGFKPLLTNVGCSRCPVANDGYTQRVNQFV